VLPEPLPSLVLGQLQTDNKDRHLSLAEPVSPHQPPLVLLSRMKSRQFVAVLLSRCAKIASIHIFSWRLGANPAMTALRVTKQLVVRILYVGRFFRFAASALSLRNGRDRGQTSARKCTSDAVSASSLRP
jgi:hypothetical protein